MIASAPRRSRLRAVRPLALRLLALASILVIDRVLHQNQQPLLPQAVLDETGHALTALIILSALKVTPWTPFWWSALAGSVLIDLDHVPYLLGSSILTHGEPRPYTHSLLTIALLAAWAARSGGARRQMLAGLAAGVGLHLVRDIATGSVPLFWPLLTAGVRVRYGLYLAVLLGAAVGGLVADVMVARRPVKPGRARTEDSFRGRPADNREQAR